MNKQFSKKLLITSALLASTCYPLAAYAAPTTDHSKDRDLEITVNDRLQKISPEALDIITEKDIAKSGATDIYDLLKRMTSLDVNTNSHLGHNVSIRGMKNSHTLILIDGERMAGEDVAQTQNVFELDRIPLSNIKEIKVIRGAQSAIYGSDALGGVINIVTKDDAINKTTVEVNAGTLYNGGGLHTSFKTSPKFTGNVDIHLTENRKRKDSDNNYMFFGPRQSYNFKGKYKIDPRHDLILNLGFYKANYKNEFADSFVPPFFMNHDKHEEKDNKRFNTSLTYYGENENSNYHLRIGYSKLTKNSNIYNSPISLLPPGMPPMGNPAGGQPMGNSPGRPAGSMPANPHQPGNMPGTHPASPAPAHGAGTGGAQGGNAHGNSHGGGMPHFTPPTKYDWDELHYKRFNIEGEKTIALGDKSVLTFGANYEKGEVSGTRIDSPDAKTITKTYNNNKATKTYGNRHQNIYGLYVEDSHQVNDKLALIGTLRYDHNSGFGGKATYRLGSIYNLDKEQKLKFNIGTAYKAPSLSQLYFNMIHNQSVVTIYIKGNPNLKPEESTNWDLSYEVQHKNFTGKLTYFDNSIKNLLNDKQISSKPITVTYTNVGKAKIKGVELSLVQDLSKQWQLRFNNTWLDAKDTTNNTKLDFRPQYKGALQLLFDDHKANGFNGGLTLNLVHDLPWTETIGHGQNAKRIPHSENYTTWDFLIAKNTKQGQIFFGVDNITNKKNENVYLIGRLWKVGANWNF